MTLRSIRVTAHGRVQGVGFRMWTQKNAQSLGLRGWVRNCADGSVEALIQGENTTVDEMIQKMHQGPRVSKVEKVEVVDTEVDNTISGFSVRY